MAQPSSTLPTAAGISPSPLVPVEAPRRPGKKWWIIAAVIVAAAVAAAVVMKPKREQGTKVVVTRTAHVTSGTIQRVMRVSGSTSARNFANIVVPVMRAPDAGRSLVLIFLAPSGSLVKKGDLIAQIDAQPVKDHVDDIETQVQQAEADIKKRRAEQAIELEALRQTLRTAKAAVDKAKLEFNAQEIRTKIDQELLKLNVEETESQYKELLTEVETTQKLYESEIKILGYTRDRHQRHRDRHKLDIDKFSMRAPLGGLVVMQTVFRSGDMGQIQMGDQLSPGQPFMKIVDSSSMQVDASVNQVSSEDIRIGQQAVVHFDAFPGLTLNGKVQNVGALGVSGPRQNYFIRTIPIRIAIQGQDNRVIPDLSASGDILLQSQDNSLILPLEAVHFDGNRPVVYLKQGDGFVEREVQTGFRNETQIAITSGLQAGDEVAMEKPVQPPKS